MNRITLENYRCFREEQNVVLAPLTLLVGDNSTGKTSFLAMIRALWNRPFGDSSFKDHPYDLGSFDEIAHYRGGRGGRADCFKAGFEFEAATEPRTKRSVSVVFRDVGTVAFPVETRLSSDEGRVWIKVVRKVPGQAWQFLLGTERGEWPVDIGEMSPGEHTMPLVALSRILSPYGPLAGNSKDQLASGTGKVPTEKDWRSLRLLAHADYFRDYLPRSLYASAPVRSRPYRTYDPSNPARDSEGDHVPHMLANMSLQANGRQWQETRKQLETFGKDSGLFDEIKIRRLDARSSDPFQLQVRKFGAPAKGPMRNMIDVGYGVSQVLPVLVELFREDSATAFLLQQPEVHLHPSAQAALGTLFCRAAADGRQLVVETHSDHLMDRVRMDVRDGTTDLRPEDVSILFFERRNLGVRIHSLRVDSEGNILDAPSSYRRFFMTEMYRSVGW